MSLEGNNILTESIQASNWVYRLFASVQGALEFIVQQSSVRLNKRLTRAAARSGLARR